MKNKALIIAGASAALICLYVIIQLLRPLPFGTKHIEVEIPKGSTFRQVADILNQKNLIRNKTLFLILGRISGIDRKVRARYYSLYKSMNTLDLLRVLRKGQIIEYEITVIEGDSLPEIADTLSEKGIVNREDFFALSKNANFLASYEIGGFQLAGLAPRLQRLHRLGGGRDGSPVCGRVLPAPRRHGPSRHRQAS